MSLRIVFASEYNARGSLFESKHWLDLLFERNLVDKNFVKNYEKIYKELSIVLNGLIKSLMKAKNSP